MVTVEVELSEDDKQPEQHLDPGEHIERVVVPLSELYTKLQGKRFPASLLVCLGWLVIGSQSSQKKMARLSMLGKSLNSKKVYAVTNNPTQAIPLGIGTTLEPKTRHQRLTNVSSRTRCRRICAGYLRRLLGLWLALGLEVHCDLARDWDRRTQV